MMRDTLRALHDALDREAAADPRFRELLADVRGAKDVERARRYARVFADAFKISWDGRLDDRKVLSDFRVAGHAVTLPGVAAPLDRTSAVGAGESVAGSEAPHPTSTPEAA